MHSGDPFKFIVRKATTGVSIDNVYLKYDILFAFGNIRCNLGNAPQKPYIGWKAVLS